MDDLNEKLDRLLSSPDGLKRIEELMGAFGAAVPNTPPPPSAPVPDMSMMLKLAPLLSHMSKDDDAAALLHALRPHLQRDRQKRLDDAGQMLKLMRMLPLLTELKKGEDDL